MLSLEVFDEYPAKFLSEGGEIIVPKTTQSTGGSCGCGGSTCGGSGSCCGS